MNNWWDEFTHNATPPLSVPPPTMDSIRRVIEQLERDMRAQSDPADPASRTLEQICRRASQLGWTVERNRRGSLYQFTFVSPDRKRTFPGQPHADARTALAETAIALNSYHFLDDK